MPKPVLGLDCDGVLADFGTYALEVINRRLGTRYANRDCTSYYFRDCLGAAAEAIANEVIEEASCYRKLRPFPQAAACVKRLAEKYDVRIVTHVPTIALRDRVEWLALHGFPKCEVLIATGGPTKVAVAERICAVAFVEDRLDTANAMAAAGIASYLVDRPWNRSGDVAPYVARGSLARITDWLMGKKV